tara:strand:+ start:15 stop:821 length:807 start_codon:yes stop_codon:yes gene_type:complete
MSMTPSIIVVTDLDGTLLDHVTYQYNLALDAMNCLNRLEIPLILNSSKTAAEIISLRQKMNNHHPFIVENGAGVYLPSKEQSNGFEIHSFGQKREFILHALNQIREEYSLPYIGFADMNEEMLLEETGLTTEQAQKAKQREFTEPLKWLGNERQWSVFCTEIKRSGLIAVKGGRFITVSGRVNKGEAMKWLRNYYQQKTGVEPTIIALGDSENDKQMLEFSDQAVLVRSSAHELPSIDKKELIITNEVGPKGWNNSVISLLQQYNLID